MADHSIWYPGAPPAEPTLADDNEAIVTATAFYLTGTSKYCKGGAWRVLASAVSSLPATVTIALRLVPLNTNPNLAAAPDRSGTATVAAGWCVVAEWDQGPVEVAEGTAMWISTDAGEPYLYIPVGVLGASAVQATDGSPLFLAEADIGAGLQPRGYYDYAGPSGEDQATWSGAHDVLMTDSLATEVIPDPVPSTLTVGTPTVSTTLAVTPDPAASTIAVGTPTLSTTLAVTPTPVASTLVIGTPATSGPGWIAELTVGSPVPNPFQAGSPRANAFAVGAPRRAAS